MEEKTKNPTRVAGGIKAAATTKRLRGEAFYKKIGRKGGKAAQGGGFAYDYVAPDGRTGPELAQEHGRIGGTLSKPYSKKRREEA